MAELSRLAESSFEAAVSFHYGRLCVEHGPPEAALRRRERVLRPRMGKLAAEN